VRLPRYEAGIPLLALLSDGSVQSPDWTRWSIAVDAERIAPEGLALVRAFGGSLFGAARQRTSWTNCAPAWRRRLSFTSRAGWTKRRLMGLWSHACQRDRSLQLTEVGLQRAPLILK
jgi:hypothetical protein